ncbi:MAG: MOSC domain-containing protein [Proteobacteria bacterium]|nr:MOSC domain-containing protein [Pseudomonadota bacterium]
MVARVLKICVSDTKGIQKSPVDSIKLVEGFGVEGDAHGGDWHRQVSLLADESAQVMRDMGVQVGPGDFGENILTQGIDLPSLPIGTKLGLGDAQLEVTQIGKECHTRCAIYDAAGTCIMPTNGIFCRVLKGGTVRPGTLIETLTTTGAQPANL